METTAIILRKLANGYLLTAIRGENAAEETVYTDLTDGLKAAKALLITEVPTELPPPLPPETTDDL